MDATELRRATDWIEEFGFWNPGAPVLRPAMLAFPPDDREARKRDAVNRAIRKLDRIEIENNFHFMIEAISRVPEYEHVWDSQTGSTRLVRVSPSQHRAASYASGIMPVADDSMLPAIEDRHVGQ